MTRVEHLEGEIRDLSREELSVLRDWFQAYLADEWDKQIEADIKAGRLDALAQEALADHKAGRTKPL